MPGMSQVNVALTNERILNFVRNICAFAIQGSANHISVARPDILFLGWQVELSVYIHLSVFSPIQGIIQDKLDLPNQMFIYKVVNHLIDPVRAQQLLQIALLFVVLLGDLCR